MEPLVSVCIPAYNNAAYIKETIDSILKQTWKNLELVICDDKSKDNTIEVIESIKDDRIRLCKNEKNLGMSGNWNKCLHECKGEFIKLICADDMLREDAIEKEEAKWKAESEEAEETEMEDPETAKSEPDEESVEPEAEEPETEEAESEE